MAEQTGKFSSQISPNWLAQIIRPFLRHTSETWLDGAAAECANLILFELDNQPEPDWADLREMARNAGWAGHADEPHVRIWGANGTDRMNLDWDAGSVRVFRHGIVVDLAGPSATYAHESVHLINPTPARVLAAARLVGLGGAS